MTAADQSEGHGGQIFPDGHEVIPFLYGAISTDDMPDHGEEKGDGVVGHSVGHGAGRIGDDDAALGTQLEIDLVVADAIPGDDAQAVGVCHCMGVEVLSAGDNGVDTGQLAPRFFVRPARASSLRQHLEAGVLKKLARR